MRCFPTALALWLLLILSAPVTVSANDMARPMTEQTRLRLSKAHKCIKMDKPECARQILSRYMETASRPHPYGVVLYGSLLLEQHELAEAASVFERGYENYPKCREIVHNLAVVRYEQERYSEAGEMFLKSCALAERPTPEIRYQGAVCFYQAELYKQAHEAVSPLLNLKQVKKNWVRLAAHCLIQLKDWPRAEKTLVRFLKVSPAEHEYWKLLANVRIERKQYTRAAAALEIAYRIKPPSEEERRSLSQLYLYVDAPLLAAHALKDDFKGTPPPKVCDQLARAYLTAGRIEPALGMIDLAIQQENTAERWLTKGKILYGKRRYAEAEGALKQAVKLKEKSGLAHFLMGMSLWEQQNWQESRDWFKRTGQFKRYAKRADRAIKSIDSMIESERQSRLATIDGEDPHQLP
ncbi:tetratricopeptide repeat protein [Salidesulfovibrio onnuriiensis]|uniref:tetratricopeptide repeat protein n=1 Tax=Salidesulfovibrio onnuriiensis TaxID=2583823 RepID=UPI0011C7010F|nr:tetratricopeptide repeat protein [Salidesulfovibrio onnuriiensis]